MSNQIILAYTVKVAGTSYGPVKAAAALRAINLWDNKTNDPVLGQALGLTVASDVTTNDSTSATRTLTLNMTPFAGAPTAPPPFPCNPITATPPVPPYPLLKAETLPGFFLTVNGSAVVGTSDSQVPSLVVNAIVQFMAQPGVFYTVMTIGASSITLTTPYTGATLEDEGAAVMLPAPAHVVAIYSTSKLDSGGIATVPPIPAGSGAQSVQVVYHNSTGGGPITATVMLRGSYPMLVTFDLGTIDSMEVTAANGFGNNVGQITLCELSSVPPAIPTDATPEEFQAFTDQAQMLITRGLAYLPPSYYTLAQQGSSQPQLDGDFTLTQGSRSIPTSEDQTGMLATNKIVEFASQPGVLYTVLAVSPKLVTLTTPYTGLNENPIDSGAFLISPSPATPPTAAQLSSPVGEFMNPGNAIPPPNPPLAPQTMSPSPTYLSGLFAKTIQLALAVPTVQSTVAFA